MRDSFGSDRFCEAVFARWFAEATAVSRRLGVPPDAREDLAHEALLRVLEHPPTGANAGAWIQRICRNLHVDNWRDVVRSRCIDPETPARSIARTAEEVVLGSERRRVVRRALLALPRAQRRALILRFYGGWSFDRIAARLGMREATMRTRVHRALAALRSQVAALRAWAAPGALSFKPAIAVLIVFAANAEPFVTKTPPAVMTATATTATTGTTTRTSARRGHAVSATVLARAEAASSADAPPAPVVASARTQSMVRAAATVVQRFDFEDDQINGDLQHPDEDRPIEVALPAAQSSLIELRRHFLPEIVKTLEDF